MLIAHVSENTLYHHFVSYNLTIFLIMTSLGPSCLLTENICSDLTINTMIFKERMIRAASYVESKNLNTAATTKARSEKASTRFHVSLKYTLSLWTKFLGCWEAS